MPKRKCLGFKDEIFTFIFSHSIDNTIRFNKFIDFIKSIYNKDVEINFIDESVSELYLPF